MHMPESPSPPADILVTGHFHEQYGYAVYRSHGSGNWLMTYTVAGRGLYRQPGVQVWAEPGDLVLLQPDALHDYSVPPDGSWEFLWAHFQPRPAWFSWWQLPELGQGLFALHLRTPQTRTRTHDAFLKLYADAAFSPGMRTTSSQQEWQPPDPLQRDLALNGLEEILLLAVREHRQSATRPLDERVQTVLDLLARDLAAQYSVADLAQQVALSPSRLAHLFKQEVGDSIQQVQLTLRLQQAARLLHYTTHSLGMIASAVGFHSSFYLSRQFRQRFGVSPREYRNRAAARDEASISTIP